MNPTLRKLFHTLVVAVVTALIVATLLIATALRALTPKADEWQHQLHVGPWTKAISMPVLIRWATHPLWLPWLDQTLWRTRAGGWYVQTDHAGVLVATCAPCTLRLPALGPAPVTVTSLQVEVERDGPASWRGTVVLGNEAPEPATIELRAQLKSDGLSLQATLAPTSIKSLVQMFGEAVPESRHAVIEGRFGFVMRARLDNQGLSDARVQPTLDGLSVSGLGTEALLEASPPARCLRTLPARLRGDEHAVITGWLPRAVIAAEDQRFFEHAGFDLTELESAWQLNQREGVRARGASTLTQQLAKMIYTGDERSAARKLREWLYAVEMERTLGKARILQLYLAIAPWGGDVCGARAAAHRHLGGKSANALAPHEAAWLASLLRRPDAQLAAVAQDGDVDLPAVERVIEAMRPASKARREDWTLRLHDWRPPMLAQVERPFGATMVAQPARSP